jgi:hypothetical protein
MIPLYKTWVWLKRWWKTVAGAAGGALVIGIGAFIAVGSYKRKVASLKDAVKVERAINNVAELRGRRQEVLAQDAKDEVSVQEIDNKLEENRRRIAEVRERAEVSAEDLVEELNRLGY